MVGVGSSSLLAPTNLQGTRLWSPLHRTAPTKTPKPRRLLHPTSIVHNPNTKKRNKKSRNSEIDVSVIHSIESLVLRHPRFFCVSFLCQVNCSEAKITA